MSNPPVKPASRMSGIVSKGLSGMFVVGVVACGWFAVQSLQAPQTTEVDSGSDPETPTVESELSLPEAKVAKASFTTVESSLRKIEDIRTVSGRLIYDQTRHIEVKAAVSGVLVDVMVKPGDNVAEGQLLAIIDSPEIGRARAAVLSERAKQAVVLRQVQRLEEITNNLRSLFVMLDSNAALNDVEKQFNDKSLGRYRQEIIAAYSRRSLSNQLATAARPLVDTGSLPLRTLRERENDRHVADAEFRSARETAAYDVGVRMQQLVTDRDDASRQVMIAENHLKTLLGFEEDDGMEMTKESLSRMEVRAPFAGTVESRSFARRERVEPSDCMFVLANTDSLYVSADIRENEWAAMSIEPGQEVTVVAPAIPGRSFTAKVHYIGREVAVESNSLPLVATISNESGLLRPGMFIRVALPVSESPDVVAVRTESVMQHENEKFVFVALSDQSFRRVNVQTGVNNEEWVEIRQGLQPGEPVVAGGAFLLKSELLLAGEEE